MCLAIPGEILHIRDELGSRTAKVKFAGITRDVNLEVLPSATVGDYVLVHVGVAISKVDPEEARRTYAALEELGLTSELDPEAAAGVADGGGASGGTRPVGPAEGVEPP